MHVVVLKMQTVGIKVLSERVCAVCRQAPGGPHQPPVYMDLASLGALPRYTCGQLYYYPAFHPRRDQVCCASGCGLSALCLAVSMHVPQPSHFSTTSGCQGWRGDGMWTELLSNIMHRSRALQTGIHGRSRLIILWEDAPSCVSKTRSS